MSIEATRPLRVALLCSAVGLFAWPGSVGAQATDPAGPDATTGADTTDANEQEEEVIVVTGSVIERKEYTTPAPVAVLSKEELDASGMVSIGEVLQNLPSQSNAINVQSNNGGDGSTRISMRGLGTGRTLVLVNGRRHVEGGLGANASVDLNAIPMAIIKRIEVLKDGASAIYGSDAIGGVVNIITRDDFEGSEATIYTGTTHRGGGTVYDISVISGINSKKGNVVFSAGYYEQKEIMAGQRAYSNNDKLFDWDGTEYGGDACDANGDGKVTPDEETFYDVTTGQGCIYGLGSVATPQGFILDATGAPGNANWDTVVNNSMSPYLARDPNNPGCSPSNPGACWRDFDFNGNSDVGEGDFYNYQPENYLLTPQRRWNAYAAGHYKISDTVRAFFETSYMKRRSDQKLAPTPLFLDSEGIVLSANNIYNPFGRDFYWVARRFTEAGTRNFLQNLDTFRTVVGLKGELPKTGDMDNWRWEVNYNFGRTEGIEVNEGRFIRSRVADALGPSFIDPMTGARLCGTPGAVIDGCVPLNLLGGEGTITAEMLKYISYTGISRGFSRQYSFNASAGGRLARIGDGGDISMAVGAVWRDHAGGQIPDPLTASGNTTGNKAEPTLGKYDVREGFAELSIVPVVGKPFAKWIELNAAIRAFDYSSFGSDFTYKVGALYKLPQGVAMRGTYSTAFRAPSVGALFSGQADSFPAVTDPCASGMLTATEQTNCAADGVPAGLMDPRSQLRSRIGGNPGLGPETAEIITSGIVVEPRQVKGLAFAIDYFWVEVSNSISTLGAALILNNCYRKTPGENTDCDKIIRGSNGLITNIIDTATNVGSTKTAGIDFSVRYEHTTGVGRFRHNLEGTWLQKFNVRDASNRMLYGKGVYDLGVFPAWKANYSALWAKEALGGGLNIRYIGGFKECQYDDCQWLVDDFDQGDDEPIYRDVKANVTADLFASYSLKSGMGRSMLTVGINNVLDTDPAVVYNGFAATSDTDTYDFLGRYYYLRFTQSF